MSLPMTPSHRPMARTLRAVAALLGYPNAELRAHLGEISQALADEAALSPARLAALDALMGRLAREDGLDVEAQYVDLFDRGRGTALHLFEHVHGDSRDRGPAMIDLIQTYEQAGLLLGPDELPDHLSVVLEFASTQPPEAARAFLGEFAHLLQSIRESLLRRRSDYAELLGALLDLAEVDPATLTGAKPAAPEPSLDESWAEPEVFGGCSSAGQQAPGQPQPIQVVRPSRGPSTPAAGA